MRFLTISAALALPSKVLAAPVCATSGAGSFMEENADWYRAILYVIYRHIPTSPGSIYTYFDELPGTNDEPSSAMASSLFTGFDAVTREDLSFDCYKCAYDFAVAVDSLFQASNDLRDACLTQTHFYVTTDSVQSPECMVVLYDPITEFNTCAGNGYDIVTKAVTKRCTDAEFVPFSIAHNPLSAMAKCAFENTSLTTVSAIERCLGSSYIADKAALNCKSCLDDLALGMQALAPTCEAGAGFDYLQCDGIPDLVTEFATCSGGFTFDNVKEGHCSADQFRVIEAMRPYTNMVKCTFYGSDESLCLDYYNSIRAALNDFDDNQNCSNHFAAFANTADLDATVCETTPFAAACIDAISSYGEDLYDLHVNAGVIIDTTSTKCSSTQWRAMADADQSYIPFVRCAMKATSVEFVLDCIESDHLSENVLETANCGSCFKQLAIEAYLARTSEVQVLCIDPYSAACIAALPKPFAFFKACSGFDSKIISNGECSVGAQAGLEYENAGLAKVIALVGNSVTVTQALFEYSQLSEALSTSDFPCMYCHLDLIQSMFDLTDDDRAICIADFTSWSCYMALGFSMDNFYRCSRGWISTTATSTPRDAYVYIP